MQNLQKEQITVKALIQKINSGEKQKIKKAYLEKEERINLIISERTNYSKEKHLTNIATNFSLA